MVSPRFQLNMGPMSLGAIGDEMDIAMISMGVGAFGLLIAMYLYSQIQKIEIENETVADITEQILSLIHI